MEQSQKDIKSTSDETKVAATDEVSQTITQKSSDKKKNLIILFLLLVIALLIGFGVYYIFFYGG